jgi:hypothetical protein
VLHTVLGANSAVPKALPGLRICQETATRVGEIHDGFPPSNRRDSESVLFGPGQVSNTRPGPFWLVNTHCQGLRICQETETEGIPSTL